MSISRYVAVTVSALAIFGCSQPPAAKAPSAASGPAADPAGASGGATTVPIPANKDVATSIALPAGTRSVGLKTGAAGFSCTNLQIFDEAGGVSNNFTDADVPPNLNMKDGASTGDTYVRVDVKCHGGAADAELTITPQP